MQTNAINGLQNLKSNNMMPLEKKQQNPSALQERPGVQNIYSRMDNSVAFTGNNKNAVNALLLAGALMGAAAATTSCTPDDHWEVTQTVTIDCKQHNLKPEVIIIRDTITQIIEKPFIVEVEKWYEDTTKIEILQEQIKVLLEIINGKDEYIKELLEIIKNHECTPEEKEKLIFIYIEKIVEVEKEVIKEVPVEVIVEVIKEVIVEKEVEVIKEVPVYIEVPVPGETIYVYGDKFPHDVADEMNDQLCDLGFCGPDGKFAAQIKYRDMFHNADHLLRFNSSLSNAKELVYDDHGLSFHDGDKPFYQRWKFSLKDGELYLEKQKAIAYQDNNGNYVPYHQAPVAPGDFTEFEKLKSEQIADGLLIDKLNDSKTRYEDYAKLFKSDNFDGEVEKEIFSTGHRQRFKPSGIERMEQPRKPEPGDQTASLMFDVNGSDLKSINPAKLDQAVRTLMAAAANNAYIAPEFDYLAYPDSKA